MNDEDIIQRIQPIFSDVFDETNPTVHADLTSTDVPEWDSLSHVLLIAEIEKAYGFRFSSSEIESLQRVGDLVRVIAKKAG